MLDIVAVKGATCRLLVGEGSTDRTPEMPEKLEGDPRPSTSSGRQLRARSDLRGIPYVGPLLPRRLVTWGSRLAVRLLHGGAVADVMGTGVRAFQQTVAIRRTLA